MKQKYIFAIIMLVLGSLTTSAQTIATTSTNKALIDVARQQGWISSTATQMTKAQAAAVTDIGTAFQYNKDLKNFEEFQYFTGVTDLKSSAFASCSNLEKITLPNSIKTISSFAFENSKLTTINLPSSVTSINDYCFSFAYSLTSITVDSSNSKYSSSNGILYDKNKATIVRYPEGKTGTSFTIPSTVTTIKRNCFQNALPTSITIPSSVTSIEVGSTFYSRNLTTITVNSSNSYYSSDNGVLYNKDKTTIIFYPAGKTGTSFTIPSTVTKIEDYCFYFTNLKSLTIPSSVTSIAVGYTFSSSDLAAINVNSSNSSYSSSDGVLYDKNQTTLIRYPQGKTGTSFTIPSSVTKVEAYCFNYAEIESITIPSSVTTIGNSSFNGNALRTVNAGWTTPPSYASSGAFPSSTYSQGTLKVPAGSASKYKSTNYWNKFTNIVEVSGSDAIATTSTNKALIEVARKQGWISSSATQMTIKQAAAVTDIGTAFQNNTDLKSFEEFQYFTGVSKLVTDAFDGCSNLEKITLPNSLKTMDMYCLMGTKLTTIHIPSSVTSISAYSFLGMRSLVSITVDSNNSNYSSDNGVLYNKDKTTIVRYPQGKTGTSFTIPSTVTKINNNCFNSTQLTSITITGNLASIPGGAFMGTSLTSFSVYSSNNNFSSDNGILYNKDKTTIVCYPEGKTGTSFTIPSSVTKVARYCFYNTKITSITIPFGVTDFDDYAFDSYSIMTVNVSWLMPPSYAYSNVFNSNTYTKGTLNVPIGAASNYRNTNYWNKFSNIAEVFGSDVIATTSTNKALIEVARKQGWIGSAASEMSMSQAAAVTNIGTAFVNNKDLTSFEEFKYFTGIKALKGAFESCSKLTKICIPSTVTSIDNSCFNGASALALITVDAGSSNFTSTDGVLFNKSKTTIVRYPEGKTGTSYTVPSTVTTISSNCFKDSKIGSVSIPEGVNNIGEYAMNTSSLLTVFSHRTNALGYEPDNRFSSNTYANGTLYVPDASISSYKNTNYWNKFAKIVSMTNNEYQSGGVTYSLNIIDKTTSVISISKSYSELEVPASVTYEGTTYSVTSIGGSAFSNDWNYAITLPSSISTINANAFKDCKAMSVIWNSSNAPLTASHINKMKELSPNVLVYVASTSQLATASLQNTVNVVVGTTGKEIALEDGYNFYCPKQFIATSISYKRTFTKKSGINGQSAGWESIALPFNVQTIQHETKGELTPFYSYSSNASKKPFWLYAWGTSGWYRAGGIVANAPYLICMPNNEEYQSAYNLNGEITFSATYTTVNKTPISTADYSSSTYAGKKFYPAFVRVDKNNGILILNESSVVSGDSGTLPAGSIFGSYGDVTPFRGYIYTTAAGAQTHGVPSLGGNDATGIETLYQDSYKPSGNVQIYDIKGQLVKSVTSDELEQTVEQLPSGIYIINGKKRVKK